jgi:hypothetical protein
MNVTNPDDTRIGIAFHNPDYTSNYYFTGWGKILTPDEMRDEMMFGNPLISTAGSATIEDSTLDYYIDNALGMVEREYDIDITPRLRVYLQPRTGSPQRKERDDIDPELTQLRDGLSEIQQRKYVTSEGTGYDYYRHRAQYYLYTKLDHRPLSKVYGWKLFDPFGNVTLDLMKGLNERIGLDAELQYFPNVGSFVTENVTLLFTNYATYPYDEFPNALQVDYMTGYENASVVPRDLIELIRKIAGISLMATYGDGKTSALAGGSVSFNSISESFQTTLSATSAAFGARIKQYQDEIKKQNIQLKQKYSRTVFGIL